MKNGDNKQETKIKIKHIELLHNTNNNTYSLKGGGDAAPEYP